MDHNANTLHLEGVTVIDFSLYLAGPLFDAMEKQQNLALMYSIN